MYPFIPERLFPVSGTRPVTTNGGSTADYVSLKDAQMAWVVIHLAQTVGHATLFSINRAKAVAPTDAVAIANVVPIWYGNVSTLTSQLAAQTDAVNFTMGGAVTGDCFIIFQIDPATLGEGYNCIAAVAANSGQATNFWEVTYWIKPRYASKMASMAADAYITD